MGNKLTIDLIAPYLPYGLKVKVEPISDLYSERIAEVDCLCFKDLCVTLTGSPDYYFEDEEPDIAIKPLLLPLSEFNDSAADTEIYEVMGSYYSAHPDFCTPDELPYKVIQILLKHHFDVFGLLESGLALDKSTYKS